MILNKLNRLYVALLAFFVLNMLYLMVFPFLIIYLILRMKESLVDQAMMIILVVYETVVILFSLLLNYKLNCGGDK